MGSRIVALRSVTSSRKSKAKRRYRAARRYAFGPQHLDELSDDQLLDTRFCQLGLHFEGTPLEQRIARLYEELEYRGIHFRPHCWFAEEWFSPDGVPGIAIPFYLGHPRLMRMERKQMLDVEGSTEDECMRILRHEAGHAIDNAYRLRRRRDWREIFGRASQPYPTFYSPKPYSRSFVLHLDSWYAQSHPVEDFAETFAVWLKPKSRWRSQYQDWPVIKKLDYVHQLMEEIRHQKPKISSRERPGSLPTVRMTLREHYYKRRAHYGLDLPNFFDHDLRRLFSDAPEHARRPTAAGFLRRLGPKLRREVSFWTGEYQYTINQVLDGMIERCRELNLRVHRPQRESERNALILLTIQTMNYLHAGNHRVAL